MELVNQTAVAAKLFVAEMLDENCRGGMLVAKATFEITGGASPRLVSQDPFPILDAQTELDDVGHMPADTIPREDPWFEVILLGACHGRGGRPIAQERVSLSVGSAVGHLVVTGDRAWSGQGREARITNPAPFARMPLVYERAYGGSAELMVDPHSLYPVFDPYNARGRGFNAMDYLQGCAALFECPPGFPVLAPGPRLLPNLEDPRAPIREWGDTPPPACWATIPADVGFMAKAMDGRMRKHGASPPPEAIIQAAYVRAHPDWTFDKPPPVQSEVRIAGVSPHGGMAFRLPALRIVADYEVGAKQGLRELKPHMLVLLTEKNRFYLVYRTFFRFDATPETVRSFRLRLVEGWSA